MTHNGNSDRRGSARFWPGVWLAALAAASSEAELVEIVKRYLRTWAPQELSSIPAHCRPERIQSGSDIVRSASRLTRAYFEWRGALAEEVLLERMATFFSQAASRLDHISSRTASPHRGNRASTPAMRE